MKCTGWEIESVMHLSLYGDRLELDLHFEMYRNIESLCCTVSTNRLLQVNYIPQKQTLRLIEKDNKFIVRRSVGWGGDGELEEGNQKVQTSS